MNAERLGGTYEVEVKTNIVDLKVACAKGWCERSYLDNKIILKVKSNTNSAQRTCIVTIEGEKIFKTINVSQEGIESTIRDLKDDILISVKNGKASSFQDGSGIEKTFDGNINDDIYHSNWNNSDPNYFPITLEYYFENADKIDYLIYYPRKDGYNGHIKEFELWVATKEKPLTKYGDYDFKGSDQPSKVDFETPLQNVTEIHLLALPPCCFRQIFKSFLCFLQFFCQQFNILPYLKFCVKIPPHNYSLFLLHQSIFLKITAAYHPDNRFNP